MLGSHSRRALAALMFASSIAPPSFADTPRETIVELTWNVPAGCPDKEMALAEIRTLLAHHRGTGERSEARVDIKRTDAGRFEVMMQTRLGELLSERRFEGATCEHVVRAATFIIALSMDPVGVAAAAASPPPAPRAERVETAPPLVLVLPSPRLGVGLGARVAGDAGSLPLPTIGATLALDVSYSRWLAEISTTFWRSRHASQGPNPEAGGDISLRTLAGRACLAPFSTWPSWYGCLGVEVGISEGTGVGILHPTQSSDLWVAALGAIAVRQKLSSMLYFWSSVDVGLPLRIPAYYIEGYGDVHRPWAVSARGTMGIELAFL